MREPEKPERSGSAIVQARCPLRKGVAAAMTQFVYEQGAEILDYDQYVNTATRQFFSRLEWAIDPAATEPQTVHSEFAAKVGTPYAMDWHLFWSGEPVRIAVFVTREIAHLYDLYVRCVSGQWNATIALIVGNHPEPEAEARRLGIDYVCLPVNQETRETGELRQLELLHDYQIDLVVLARYMQVITDRLITPYTNRIINIHHSMLPAFAGAKPYHRAHQRGVKLIGATSHYVTAELDAGPIIAQDVVRVDHRKSPRQLIALGRDLETQVLARAVGLHINRRILIDDGRTVVFD